MHEDRDQRAIARYPSVRCEHAGLTLIYVACEEANVVGGRNWVELGCPSIIGTVWARYLKIGFRSVFGRPTQLD